MISAAEPVPVEVRLERMRMALAEVGIDGSGLILARGPAGDRAIRVVEPTSSADKASMWRADQIAGTPHIFCFKCWEADLFNSVYDDDFVYTCLAPVGVYDCGRSDR